MLPLFVCVLKGEGFFFYSVCVCVCNSINDILRKSRRRSNYKDILFFYFFLRDCTFLFRSLTNSVIEPLRFCLFSLKKREWPSSTRQQQRDCGPKRERETYTENLFVFSPIVHTDSQLHPVLFILRPPVSVSLCRCISILGFFSIYSKSHPTRPPPSTYSACW